MFVGYRALNKYLNKNLYQLTKLFYLPMNYAEETKNQKN